MCTLWRCFCCFSFVLTYKTKSASVSDFTIHPSCCLWYPGFGWDFRPIMVPLSQKPPLKGDWWCIQPLASSLTWQSQWKLFKIQHSWGCSYFWLNLDGPLNWMKCEHLHYVKFFIFINGVKEQQRMPKKATMCGLFPPCVVHALHCAQWGLKRRNVRVGGWAVQVKNHSPHCLNTHILQLMSS